MSLRLLLEALGGLGIFIFGMKTMSEGLQRLAGEKIRRSLEKLTANRLTATFMGGCLTSLLQSSGAASIIIVGLVNAGLISLYQALGMLVGTSLGTTFVVQLLAFKISYLAAPAIFFGVILKFFARKRRKVYLGEVLLGLGLLFLGLSVMQANFTPLRQSAIYNSYQSLFPSWPLFGVLFGAVLTFLVQSGSASIGIIIALAGGGFLQFNYAVAMVVGETLGTSWLAAIGSINGTLAAKRTVLLYFLMMLFSILVVLLLFPFFIDLVYLVSPGKRSMAFVAKGVPLYGSALTVLSRTLANAHTLFSFLQALVLLPLIGFLTRSAVKILPAHDGEGEMEPRLRFIDYRVVNTPTIAYVQASNELKRMAGLAKSMFCDVAGMFAGYDARKFSIIKQKENVMDALQKDIAAFLVTLARKTLTPEISVGIPAMLQVVSALENIADCSETILECLRRKKEGNIYFSDTAMQEIQIMAQHVIALLDQVIKALDEHGDEAVVHAGALKETISRLRYDMKMNHINRLSTGSCTVIAGLLYIDMISSFDRIGELALEITENERGIR